MENKIFLSENEKQELLRLSRSVIETFLSDCNAAGKEPRSETRSDIAFFVESFLENYDYRKIPVLNKSLSCFVTLNERNNDIEKEQLRGCIGSLQPQKNELLVENLTRNSIMAAFYDYRFPPVSIDELSLIIIEISILSKPVEIYYDNLDELINKIDKKGVVLEYGYTSATFLPQVWESLPNPIDFLTHLAIKAGLSPEKYQEANYKVYDVYSFSEK